MVMINSVWLGVLGWDSSRAVVLGMWYKVYIVWSRSLICFKRLRDIKRFISSNHKIGEGMNGISVNSIVMARAAGQTMQNTWE